MKTLLILCTLAYSLASTCDDDGDEECNTKNKRPTYEDPDPYKNLVDWLRDGKAEFNKVEIEVRSEGYRALRAKQYINRGEWVLFIPKTHFLTLDEVKKSCLVNRKMIQVNHQPMSTQTYFVNHLLQEKRRKNSVWKPYIQVLPTDVSGFPTYFDQEQLDLLKGSPSLETVMEQRQQFRQEYDNLYREIAEFRRYNYTYPDFLKFRILTNSRSFTVVMNNEHVSVLVPLADFVNHDNDGFLGFDYSPQHNGFYMQANRDIRKGEELFYSYGKMSNKFFFMHHGFALESITMNQYDFDMCVDDNDPLAQLKLALTNGHRCYRQRLVNETDHGTFRETIANARYLAVQRLDEYFALETKVQGYRFYNPAWHTWPINTPLEKKMWIFLRKFLQDHMNNFASTIEDDIRRLNDKNTPEFRRHIIVLTIKEKQIIKENIDVCNMALEIVESSSTELQNFIRYAKYQKIAGYVRQELIPMKVEKNE